MPHSALAVHADELSCKALKLALEVCNCHAVCSRSLEDAAALLRQRGFDIVVQDWNLPGRTPAELCQRVRSREDPCHFVIVNAPDSDILQSRLLDLGADECINVSTSCEAMLSRLRARVRRLSSSPALPVHASGGLVMFDSSRTASLGGLRIKLTHTEYDLLSAIAGEKGVVPRSDLLMRFWGSDDRAAGKLLDIHIANLRRKLGSSRHLLETVRGAGFRWTV